MTVVKDHRRYDDAGTSGAASAAAEAATEAVKILVSRNKI